MLRDVVTPSQSTQQFQQDSNGILLFYDNSRSKYISVSREEFSFGIRHRNITGTRWLAATSNLITNVSGYKIPRNASITAITVQTQNSAAGCTFDIFRNGVAVSLTSISLSSETSKIIDNLDLDLNQGDWLQCQLTVTSGTVDYPMILLEIAWR